MSDLERMKSLADLVKRKNEADRKIAEVIGRPALQGHFGEYVAARTLGANAARLLGLYDEATRR